MISVDPEVVFQTANTVSSINTELEQVLTDSNKAVHELEGSWTGEASQATISAFNSFFTKYQSEYKDMLDKYVDFLNQQVGEGYIEANTSAKNKADLI